MNKYPHSGSVEKLAALRRSLAKAVADETQKGNVAPLGHEEADACLNGGLKLGILHEVFASDANGGAASGFAAVLARLCGRGKHLFWIRQDFSALENGEVFASGLLELGLHPACLFLMRAADATDALRAGLEALTCAHLGAIVLEIPGEPKILDLTATRRLTLAAHNRGVTAILLRFSARPMASACETRWCVAAAPSLFHEQDWGTPAFDVELQRNRHGPAGHWVMEWSADDGVFKRRTADSGTLAAASSNRPHQEKERLLRSA